MFFGGRGEPPPGSGSGSAGNEEIKLPERILPPCNLWISIIIPNAFNLLSVILNLFCFVLMARKCTCTFTSSQNLLMMVLMATMVEAGLNGIIFSILGEVLSFETPIVSKINQISDLFLSYFSITIIFLVGFNRMCVYTNPRINSLIFPRKRLGLILIILGLICLVIVVIVINECGVRTNLYEGLLVDYVLNITLLKTTNYIAYSIAIASTVFYVRIYFHLRDQRENVTHDKTKEMLIKAEMVNSYQGAFILVVYSVSLVIFVLFDTVRFDDSIMWLLHIIQNLVNALPMLAIPTALLVFCPIMRRDVKQVFSRGSRKGSASSLKRTSTIAVSF